MQRSSPFGVNWGESKMGAILKKANLFYYGPNEHFIAVVKDGGGCLE